MERETLQRSKKILTDQYPILTLTLDGTKEVLFFFLILFIDKYFFLSKKKKLW